MRTIKFLGLAAALAAVSATASAQSGRAVVGSKDSTRVEAPQLQHQQVHPRAMKMGMRGPRMGMRGQRRAFAAGRMMGYRAGINATPAQRQFFKARDEQRKAVHAQVRDGKLTREQARTQMQAWAREHRPK